MKIWMPLVFLLGIYANSYAQSSFAVYSVVSSMGSEKMGFPSELRVTYNVWADSNFIEIIGMEDTIVVLGADAKLNQNPSQEHIIISIKDSLVLFVNENRFAKVKYYAAEPVKKKKGVSTVSIPSKGVTIQHSSKLPHYVTPGIFVTSSGAAGGIRSVSSSQLKINLVKTEPSAKVLDHARYFQGEKKVSGVFEFF